MPKSTASTSPQSNLSKKSKNLHNAANDNEQGDPNDTMRKKKNADAQAAFRMRRQTYITTLEETVTNLESVVLQLQDSCRESKAENMELRQELTRLRFESREREKYWRSLVHTRKAGHPPDIDEAPPPQLSPPFAAAPSSYSSTPLPPPATFNSNGTYRASDPPSCQPFAIGGNDFGNHPGSVPFSAPENSHDIPGSVQDRGAKFTGYQYPVQDSPRDPRWPVTGPLSSGLPGPEPIAPPAQSPYVESPALTASTEMAGYPTRFPPNDRKVPLDNVLDNAPYIFPNGDRYHTVADSVPNSRSMSPTSTGSSTSLPLTSSFPFAYQDPHARQDHPEFDYRRQTFQHGPEMSIHAGTADVSFHGGNPPNYRLVRRPDDPTMMQSGEPGPHYEQDDYASRNRLIRRQSAHPYARSPSPGPQPISCTVAVIKAQAFGALRRTRTKPKKDTDSAAKVAINVLEARGIAGPSPGGKLSHPDDDDDLATP